MKKVSIILPAYNASRFIKETIESVIHQEYTNWELIIINDGSTDKTQVIIESITDDRIQILKIENGGVSNARNVGFEKSNGSYVAFLDADDVWLKDNLALKVTKLDKQKEIGLVHSDTQVIDAESIPTREIKKGKEGDLLKDLLLWNGTCIPSPSSILVRREVMNKVGAFNVTLSTAADQEFFFRVADKFKIGRIPKVTWRYRIHEQNMHQNIKHMEEDHIRAYRIAEKEGLFENWEFKRKCFSNLYFILAGSWWVNRNKHPRTWLFLWKSIWCNPFTLPRIIRKLL